MLADNDMDLHLARLATWHAAWVLDQGGLGLVHLRRIGCMPVKEPNAGSTPTLLPK